VLIRGCIHIVAIELVRNFTKTEASVANSFFQQYLLAMLGDVFYVLTDTDHKSGKLLSTQRLVVGNLIMLGLKGFKLQALLLQKLINLVESGQVTASLWDAAVVTQPGMTNPIFLREHIASLLQNAFTHVQS
jgi:exportin-1